MAPYGWLMKAEPDSRIVKGKDVKFSVDDFEKMKVSPWDGVRNPEASKSMRERMKLGHKVLFYHSNTKVPGVAAFAEVAKEGYPDHTAWDSSHPYFDPKTDKEKPKWYMVDVKFVSRAEYLVPLVVLKHLATLSEPPESLSYLSAEHLTAIKNMALLGRGRLSVQPVDDKVAWEAIELLAAKGGWDEVLVLGKGKAGGKRKVETAEDGDGDGDAERPEPKSKKRKAAAEPPEPPKEGVRRSARLKNSNE